MCAARRRCMARTRRNDAAPCHFCKNPFARSPQALTTRDRLHFSLDRKADKMTKTLNSQKSVLYYIFLVLSFFTDF
jgi:hypothetical protein